ncbi:MerR family transcriptional regulator (plasmid) [Lactiplantibacillus plantarum]
MKLAEFANRIGVSEQTLRNWDKSGKLVAKRTKGNHRFYTEDDYNDYMGISSKNQKEVSNMKDIQEKWLADFVDSMSEEEAKKIAKQAIQKDMRPQYQKDIEQFVNNMSEDDMKD